MPNSLEPYETPSHSASHSDLSLFFLYYGTIVVNSGLRVKKQNEPLSDTNGLDIFIIVFKYDIILANPAYGGTNSTFS